MRFARIIQLRLRSLLARQKVEEELDEELQYHLQRQIDENVAAGMNREEASCAALQSIRDLEQRKEECRDMRQLNLIESLFQDLRYALRMIRQTPAVTALAVLSLALGIGANTAIFSLIDAVLLHMLPVRQPAELVILDCLSKNGARGAFSHADFEWLRDRNPMFSGVFAASYDWRVDWTDQGKKKQLPVRLVSGNFFSVLGVPPTLGHTFTEHDDQTGNPVAVLSYDFWKRRFGQNPEVLHRSLALGTQSVQIIGVAPPDFYGVAVGSAPDVWVPLSMQPSLNEGRSFLHTRNVGWLELMARLRPGITPEKARLGLAVLYSAVQAELRINPQSDVLNRIGVSPGAGGFSFLRLKYSQPLHTLMAIVALVLLIACANVSNLLLARAVARQREFAVRLALGAARTRIIRQLLTEALLLALLAGLFGLLVAWVLSRVLLHWADATTIEVALHGKLLAFTAAISLLTAVLFGVVPSSRSAGVDPAHATKLDARAMGERSSHRRFSRALVVLQVAVSFVLLVTAGLLVKSLQNLRRFHPGFDRTAVVQVQIDPGAAGYKGARAVRLASQLIERVQSLPGVQSASSSTFLFGSGVSRTCCVTVPGRTPQRDEDKVARTQSVAPGYFQTMGIPFRGGRDFTPADVAGKPEVAIINETMAHRYFGNENPVGRRFGWALPESQTIEVIGVVKDAHYDSLREQTPPMVYQSLLQHATNPNYLEVRMAPGRNQKGESLLADIRSAIRKVDLRLSVTDMSTMTQVVDRSLAQEKAVAQLASAFGVLAALLAVMGLYGVLSYTVARRTGEIGIRMALGAQRHTVQWAFLRETVMLCLTGLMMGGLVAWMAQRLIVSELFELSPLNPLILALSAALLLAFSLAAGFLPARRASRIDPMIALRQE